MTAGALAELLDCTTVKILPTEEQDNFRGQRPFITPTSGTDHSAPEFRGSAHSQLRD